MYKKYFTLFFVFFSVGLIAQNMSKLTPQQQRRMQEQMSMGSGDFKLTCITCFTKKRL